MLGIVKSKRYKEAEAFKDIIELLFEFLRSPRSLKVCSQLLTLNDFSSFL